MQSISLYDYLEFARAEKLEVHAPAGITADIKENLVYRAARIFLDKYAPDKGVRITLEKNIPLAAGLAGGSTDCAGVLYGLNKFFNLNLPATELESIANPLGSDIAYCLHGGTYLAKGRGELLTKLPELPVLSGLLLKPPFSLSTAAVYQQFAFAGKAGQKKAGDISTYLKGEIIPANLPQNMHNDLSQPALVLLPELQKYFQLIESTQPLAQQMSGSGPAIFAFYADSTARNKALQALKEYEVYSIETVSCAQTLADIHHLST